jgi:hypothetical protein
MLHNNNPFVEKPAIVQRVERCFVGGSRNAVGLMQDVASAVFVLFISTGFGLAMRNTCLPLTRSEVERCCVEHRLSFLIHYAISEAFTLCLDPIAQ